MAAADSEGYVLLPMSELELISRGGGVEVAIWAKPRASKSRVLGVREGQLEVAIAAPPVDGAANTELLRVLASQLGISRSRVELLAGQAGRTKRVRFYGMSEAEVRAQLLK
jgi:uncharacterized protein